MNDQRAVTLAQRSRSVNPFALDPLYQAAAAELDQGAQIKHAHAKGWLAAYRAANERAYGYFKKATEVQPKNAEAWYQLGFFQLVTRGCPRAALPAFNLATVLRPAQPDVQRLLREDAQARELGQAEVLNGAANAMSRR